MKSILLLPMLLGSVAIHAQGVFSNNTNSALLKVIEDYPNKFVNIKGDKITSNHQATNYHSKIEVPGAVASIITHHYTSNAEVYCWKTELFESLNFNASQERFKELFNSIKNTIVKIEGLPPYILNGKYEFPSEDKKNTTIGFRLLPASGDMQKLTVDLTLSRAANGWKISLSVYEKDLNNNAMASSDR